MDTTQLPPMFARDPAEVLSNLTDGSECDVNYEDVRPALEMCLADGHENALDRDILSSLDDTAGLSVDGRTITLTGTSDGVSDDNDTDEQTADNDEPTKPVFTALVEYFHGRLDDDLPTDEVDEDIPETPRDYFQLVRGWTDETINDRLLGYAPSNEYGAYEHLTSLGYSRDEIRSTGAFTETESGARPTCLWRGRYVLPYFNADGDPVYAISRAIAGRGGGAVGYGGHPNDIMAGKYAKLAHSRDYVTVDEPIYGLSTLDTNVISTAEGDKRFVIVAEGIADAISCIQNDLPVISPVTVQFKAKHHDEVLSIIHDHDIDVVYVVPDNEEASPGVVERDDTSSLNIEPIPAGLRGGLSTAKYLVDNDVDARVVTLPRPGGRKMDLDEFVQTAGVDALARRLLVATPPSMVDGYEHVVDDSQSTSRNDDGLNKDLNKEGSNDSALWDLDITEVMSGSWSDGDRGKNPLGHTGDSENYFVVQRGDDGDLVAYDHKRKAGYNAVTYLLCSQRERSLESPGGSLSDREIYLAWKHAKDNGVLGDDDPIPRRALNHVHKMMENSQQNDTSNTSESNE